MKKVLILLLCAALLLSGCGAGKSSYAANEKAYPAETAAAYDTGSYDAASGDSGSGAELPQGRKFIITMNVDAETDNLDSALNGLNTALAEVSGYIQDQNIYNGSAYYSGRRYRSASLTLRIPADSLDEFQADVASLANVTSSSRSSEDVTLQYVDTESRVTALKTEQDRLMELLSQAETMADLLEIESRLTQVRSDLESYTSQLKVLENQVDYATMYLNLSEVTEYTPVAEKTRLQKIGEGFVKSLKDLGNGILDFGVWILVELPYLIVIGLVGFGLFRLVKKLRKKKGKKETPPKADEA